MGMTLIKQSDDKFGLFDTHYDRIFVIDATDEELIQVWKTRAALRAEAEMREWLEEVKTGKYRLHEKPISLQKALKMHTFDMTQDFDKILKSIK